MPDDVAVLDQQQDAGATAADSAQASPEAPRVSADYAKAFASFDDVFGGSASDTTGSSSETPAADQASKPPAETSAPAQAATAQDGASATDSNTDGEVAEAATDPNAATDGKPQDKKPSRAERIHLEYQEKLAEKDRELAAAREELAKATGTLSAEAQREQAVREQFLDAYGPDDEYERLTIANNKGLALTPNEYDNLQRWTTTRELAKPFQSVADARAQAAIDDARESVRRAGLQFADYLREQLNTRVQKYGLDADTVQKAEYGGLIDHAVSVTERRKDSEYAPQLKERDDRISQIEAQLREAQDIVKSLRPELLRGGHPSEVAATQTRVYSERNIRTPLVDDWASAFK